MRDFLKQISIYGILPVAGKFVGFFLIPIYVRVFSTAEFGMVELLITLAQFLMFGCNLEFYTAIGRFFYEKENLEERRKLISTGLMLTFLFTIIVVVISIFSEDWVMLHYLKSTDYRLAYRLSIVWLFFAAFYTYLSVIPRYDKKPRLYVRINLASLLLRVGSTIFYVLVLDWGIDGVIAGHITGALTASFLNAIVSWKYLGLCYDKKMAADIIKFAVPIVPGLLLVGLWQPLSRNFVSVFYSLESLGLLAFALKVTSLMLILNSAIGLAWNPMLFEDHKKTNFRENLKIISQFMGIIIFCSAIAFSLLSPEITKYIGTTEYESSMILFGFLSFQIGLEILKRIRGFGPLILNKTYLLSLNEILGIMVGVVLLYVLKDFGLVGIGIAFLTPSILKYFFLVGYTSWAMQHNFYNNNETIYLAMLILSNLMLIYSSSAFYRYSFLAIVMIYSFYLIHKKFDSLNARVLSIKK